MPSPRSDSGRASPAAGADTVATLELGTNANDSLEPAIAFKPGYGSGMSAADIAAMALAIKDDPNVAHPVYPNAFSSNGILYVPNRGQLQMLPGDVVGVDPISGWPILVSAYAISVGSSVWRLGS